MKTLIIAFLGIFLGFANLSFAQTNKKELPQCCIKKEACCASQKACCPAGFKADSGSDAKACCKKTEAGALPECCKNKEACCKTKKACCEGTEKGSTPKRKACASKCG